VGINDMQKSSNFTIHYVVVGLASKFHITSSYAGRQLWRRKLALGCLDLEES